MVHNYLQDFKNSVIDFGNCIELDPNNLEAYYNRSLICHSQTEQFDIALIGIYYYFNN
jgi:hypothetical protein